MNRIKTILTGAIVAVVLLFVLWEAFKWTAMRIYVGPDEALVVTNKSTDIEDAFSGAADKMHRQLETTYGRLADKRRRKQKMEARVSRLPSASLAE